MLLKLDLELILLIRMNCYRRVGYKNNICSSHMHNVVQNYRSSSIPHKSEMTINRGTSRLFSAMKSSSMLAGLDLRFSLKFNCNSNTIAETFIHPRHAQSAKQNTYTQQFKCRDVGTGCPQQNSRTENILVVIRTPKKLLFQNFTKNMMEN